MFNSLFEFYRSKEWEKFRQVVIGERMRPDGFVYDEVTGKPIVKAYDIILHHIEELTEENVNDYNISLNPSNIQLVSHKTHNIIHNKLGHMGREVYLVYGAPFAGKREWVADNMVEGDLVCDIDDIWQCVSGCARYTKPNRLKAVVFKTRDLLIDNIKYRVGKWHSAYIVGGYALQSERNTDSHSSCFIASVCVESLSHISLRTSSDTYLEIVCGLQLLSMLSRKAEIILSKSP